MWHKVGVFLRDCELECSWYKYFRQEDKSSASTRPSGLEIVLKQVTHK